MKKIIKWEEPPPSRGAGRPSEWAEVATQLKASPGKWALVAEGQATGSMSNHIRNGKINDFRPPGSFDAVSRRTSGTGSTALHNIWARYVGDESTADVIDPNLMKLVRIRKAVLASNTRSTLLTSATVEFDPRVIKPEQALMEAFKCAHVAALNEYGPHFHEQVEILSWFVTCEVVLEYRIRQTP